MQLKIGDLAQRVGLTVRTLHHYDKIGLLSPSNRSDSGFRLYGPADLVRLHRIQALKQLGYGLGDIQALLGASAGEPLDIIRQQMVLLDQQAERTHALRQRLGALEQQMLAGGMAGARDWLDVLEMMTLHSKHLTDKDLARLHGNRNATSGGSGGLAGPAESTPSPLPLGPEWAAMFAEVQAGMAQGLVPESAPAVSLAWRWMRQLQQLTGSHAGLALKLKTLLESEERAQQILGVSPAMLRWVTQAWAHGRMAVIAKYIPAAEVAGMRARMLAHVDEWPALMAQFCAQMDAAARPEDPAVQALAQRWRQLFRATYCGDNLALEAPVRQAFQAEPDLRLGIGIDSALIGFVQQAIMAMLAASMPGSGAGNTGSPGGSKADAMATGEAQRGYIASAGPKPSAMLVANLRAVHQLVDTPLIFEDPLALTIIGDEAAAELRAQADQFKDAPSTALRTSLVIRSRLVEDECQDALWHGVRQTVILGAGLDTYAYRHAASGSTTAGVAGAAGTASTHSATGPKVRLFEVDLPATQQWKRELLRNAHIPEPAELTYVPVDFERTSLADGLAAAGFQPQAPAFFSWLGVTMYLDDAAIRNTLRCIVSGAKGTSVVFDYLVDPAVLSAEDKPKMAFLAARIAERGEPWKTWFDPAKLADLLLSLGFSQVKHFTPEDLTEKYLAGRQDGLRLAGLSQMVRATV